MPNVTLVLTHTPRDEFIYNNATATTTDEVDAYTAEEFRTAFAPNTPGGRPRRVAVIISGLWGTMAMLRGPKVHRLGFRNDDHLGTDVPAATPPQVPATGNARRLELRVQLAATEGRVIQRFRVNNRVLELETDPGATTLVQTYTTAERYRGSTGGVGGNQGYVMLRPRPMEAYRLENKSGYQGLIDMRATTEGKYIRIYGGATAQEQAILIHEAAHPGWVVGCIAPRPLNNRTNGSASDNNNPSAQATREIMRELAQHGGGRGELFILD